MAIEKKRGCGYRKVGGIYLVGSGPGRPCGRLPIPLQTCPACGAGFHQNRGWTWINPELLFRDVGPCMGGSCDFCPLASPATLGTQAGLIWVGKQFYPSPEDFDREARAQGISRRIPPNVARQIAQVREKIGEYPWVLLAHPEACWDPDDQPMGGVFRIFRPSAMERIITQSQAGEPEVMQALQEQGLSAVIVPDNDADHNPAFKGESGPGLFD